jgi:hypothetical protein
MHIVMGGQPHRLVQGKPIKIDHWFMRGNNVLQGRIMVRP